jgi:hypothetical protein
VLKLTLNLCVQAQNPQRLFNELRSRPDLLQRLRRDQPQLVDAIEQNDISMIRSF